MIKSLEIQGFKGFRERTQIDFRPLTLLFGPNSAGKSTILHAFSFVRDLLDGHFAASRSLGRVGFADVVHGHDLDQPISFNFELTPPPRLLRKATDFKVKRWGGLQRAMENMEIEAEIESFESLFSRFSVYLDVGCGTAHRPILMGYQVSIDDTPAFRCELAASSRHYRIVANTHSTLWHEESNLRRQYLTALFNWTSHDWAQLGVIHATGSDLVHNSYVVPDERAEEGLPFPGTGFVDTEVLGPLRVLKLVLDKLIHIGPLRSIPPADFVPTRQHFERWGDGFAAWAILHEHGEAPLRAPHEEENELVDTERSLLAATNQWLHGTDGLKTGYWLELERIVEAPLPDGSIDRDLRRTLKRIVERALGRPTRDGFEALSTAEASALRAFADKLSSASVKTRIRLRDTSRNLLLNPKSLGSGISQVLPVIVAALDWEYVDELVAVEQPELHVHPAIQTRLADLFIGRGKTFLIETHSEHMLLRLLRRIRETFDECLPRPELALRPRDVAINYIETRDGATEVTRLLIDETGDFVGGWPEGFFEERLPEVL